MRRLKPQKMSDLAQRGSQHEDKDGELALPGRLPRLVCMPSSMAHNCPPPFQDSSRNIRDGVGTQDG